MVDMSFIVELTLTIYISEIIRIIFSFSSTFALDSSIDLFKLLFIFLDLFRSSYITLNIKLSLKIVLKGTALIR